MTWTKVDPDRFVAEALTGLVAANADLLVAVDGGVVRAAAGEVPQVALVVGGGAGHYPAFAGFVGSGLAAGAACGNVFTSPSAAQIQRVARAADEGAGVLFSYGNYAGDVLHFGEAQRKLREEGIDARTVMCTDDIASATSAERERRRGVAGDLVVFKVAGAASARGWSLDEVERVAREANDRTRTLGVAFAGCTLPGADAPLFQLPPGRFSLGLGIHGEPGISEHDTMSARALAELLVETLLADLPQDAGTRVVAVLNGLGGVKYEELFVVFARVVDVLAAHGLELVEPECGELVTSLEMAGLSLTLFWPDAELESLWADPADAAGYRKRPRVTGPRRVIPPELALAWSAAPATGAEREAATLAERLIEHARDTIRERAEELGHLDAIAGDGDHGIGMLRGLEAAADAAAAAVSGGAGVSEALTLAGESWAENAGGTSGALWGAALVAGGRALAGIERPSSDDALGAIQAGIDEVISLGGAIVGDKTMLDAMVPFGATLTTGVADGQRFGDAFRVAAVEATDAADLTRALTPRRGRARPLAERSLGHPDPGAVSFAIIMTAVSGLIDAKETR